MTTMLGVEDEARLGVFDEAITPSGVRVFINGERDTREADIVVDASRWAATPQVVGPTPEGVRVICAESPAYGTGTVGDAVRGGFSAAMAIDSA
jgi:hypothetical protein